MTTHSRKTAAVIKSTCLTLLLLVTTVTASGCLPTFLNPIPLNESESHRSKLLGLWRSKQDDSKQTEALFIIPRGKDMLELVHISDINSPSNSDGASVGVYEGYCGSIDENKILCLRIRPDYITDPNEQKFAHWFLMNYYIDDDSLKFCAFSTDKIAALVNDGFLEGTVKKEQHYTDVHVTSPGPDVAKLIQQLGIEKFIDPNESTFFTRTATF